MSGLAAIIPITSEAILIKRHEDSQTVLAGTVFTNRSQHN